MITERLHSAFMSMHETREGWKETLGQFPDMFQATKNRYFWGEAGTIRAMFVATDSMCF